jgi:hypothetical protein
MLSVLHWNCPDVMQDMHECFGFASILNVDMLAAFLDEKIIYKNISENAYLLSEQFWENRFCVYKNRKHWSSVQHIGLMVITVPYRRRFRHVDVFSGSKCSQCG